ncbi:pilus assembly protein CpaF [Serinibacter arcticus]|uniref:Pilus assembly protein CpaF n=1 Tax=Serinibacter arcticus TaxID=1655435 RepID=A0A2U1ZTD1_9MICO|nr:ATPase, T2SS/T4P/T4SS family [Serinibacter arcticus]PWD50245.1 pilus assembly protein CpaF [Serinibacter arcticus]
MAVGTAQLEAEVRELVRRRGIDPARDTTAFRGLVADAVIDYEERVLRGTAPALPDSSTAAKTVLDAVAGLGPLQVFLDDPTVEELWINAPGRVFVARNGVPELTTVLLTTDEVRDLTERMLRPSGRRLDLSTPFVDATLTTGERVHVVIPDVTRSHIAVNVRKYTARAQHLDDLVALGTLPERAAAFLDAVVAVGLNVVVSGATQAGKTTMLGALCGSIPSSQRLITCEEVFELQPGVRDHVGMQCRQPNLEGTGEITLRRLVKEALRMRPDRLVIGEVREAESLDLLIALNAGLPGMGTVHANSAREAVHKLCILPLLAGSNVSSTFVVPTVASAIDIVVHMELDRSGRRSVREILAVTGRAEGGVVETSDLFHRSATDPLGHLTRGNGYPSGEERFERAGHDLAALLGDRSDDGWAA